MSEFFTEDQIAAHGQQVERSKWNLPECYQLTPEMLKRSDDDQAALARRAASPYDSMSPQEYYRATSVKIAEELRDTIENLKKQAGSVLIGGDGDLAEIQAAIIALSHKRAERLAAVGRYDLAREIEPNEQYRKEYERILDAIWRDDDETCECDVHRGSGSHTGIAVSQRVAALDVYSMKHGRMVSLMKCNHCGFLNAIDTPEDIIKMRAHRSRAHGIAAGLSIADAAKALTASGHTAARLLSKK